MTIERVNYVWVAGFSRRTRLGHIGRSWSLIVVRGTKGLGAQRQQIVLAQQSQHAFGVHDQTPSAQLLGDAPIPVMAFRQRDALDQIAQVRDTSRRTHRRRMLASS